MSSHHVRCHGYDKWSSNRPPPSRHINVNQPYLGLKNLPQINSTKGVTAAYTHQNHVIVRTPCPVASLKKPPMFPTKAVKCARGHLPLNIPDNWTSIYEDLMDKWVTYQRDAECLDNCSGRGNRVQELTLRLAQLQRRMDALSIYRPGKVTNAQLTRLRKIREPINLLGSEKLYYLKKPQPPFRPVQLAYGLSRRGQQKQKKLFGGEIPTEMPQPRPEDLDPEPHYPSKPKNFKAPKVTISERIIDYMVNAEKRRINPPPKPALPDTPAVKSALKRFTERRIRRPSWLPNPDKKMSEIPRSNLNVAHPSANTQEEDEGFNKKTEKAFRRMFNYFDLNEDGQISQEEMYKSLKCLGFALTYDDNLSIITNLDKNRDMSVSFKEFVAYYKDMDNFADYLVPPTVKDGKYHKKFLTIMYSVLGEFITKEVLSKPHLKELKRYYSKRFEQTVAVHPDLNYKIEPWRPVLRVYGPTGGELREKLEKEKDKIHPSKKPNAAGGSGRRQSSITREQVKLLLSPPYPRAPYPGYSEESGKSNLYPGLVDKYKDDVEMEDKEVDALKKKGRPLMHTKMIGKAREELRLGRLNRRKKMVIIFRPFARKRKIIKTKFMPFIMPWEKNELNFKTEWKPRKTFEQLSPQSSMDVRRAYADVIVIRKDGSVMKLKRKVPKKHIDHMAWLFYQRYVSVSSFHYTYDFVLDLPSKYLCWPIDKLMKLRKQLVWALRKFNKAVAGKRRRNLVAHFVEMHLCDMLSPRLYNRFMQYYCDYANPDPSNDASISTDWLKKAVNCMQFRLKCSESAFWQKSGR